MITLIKIKDNKGYANKLFNHNLLFLIKISLLYRLQVGHSILLLYLIKDVFFIQVAYTKNLLSSMTTIQQNSHN